MGAAREHVERGLELWNNGDFDALVPVTAEDVVYQTPMGTVTGAAAVADMQRQQLAAVPDRRFTAMSWAEDGDTVIVEGEWTGTHSGPLPLADGSLLPPTGQRLAFEMVGVYEVKDGKTVAYRAYWDRLPLMMQLGVVAPTQRP